MTPTLVSLAADPLPAPRADLIFTAHYGAQRSPLTEVRHARRTRRLAVAAVATGLVAVTAAAASASASIVLMGTW